MSPLGGAVLFTGIVLYGVFAGADFGTGLWDLTAGGARRGARPRELIDHAIGPVWEANHTWLIFVLVLLWTGFPAAFAAVMTTLYVPLGVAALGIVLRGAGFAFRKVALTTSERRLNGVAFAVSSVVTPFCFGAVAGGVASGRVPAQGHGDALASWVNPTSVLGGALSVLTCGYLAAVFLTAEANRLGDGDLERWARRRALLSGAVTGVVAATGPLVLHADAPRLFDRLLAVGWPELAVSAAAGLGALGVALRGRVRLVRPLGALAVVAVLAGWGAAQLPYLLGTHLTLAEAAAPSATLRALVVVTVAFAVLVLPSLALLYALTTRGSLTTAGHDHASAAPGRPGTP